MQELKGPYNFYTGDGEVLSYLGEAKGPYANTITLVWPAKYAKYYALLHMKEIGAGIPPKQLAHIPKYEAFMVSLDKLPLLYKLVAVMKNLLDSDEWEKRENEAKRKLEKTYVHVLDRLEIVALIILAGVEHSISYQDAHKLPDEKAPGYGEKEEKARKLYDKRLEIFNEKMRKEGEKRMNTLIDDFLCSRLEDAEDMEEVTEYLEKLAASEIHDVQDFALNETPQSEEQKRFFAAMRDYLLIRDRGVDLLRGDLVELDENYQGLGLLIYNGRDVINLDNTDDSGFAPKEFLAITEFPPFYWFDHLSKSRAIYIDPSQLHIDSVTFDPAYDRYRSAVGGMEIGYDVMGDEKGNIAVLKASYGGKQYTFVVDYPMNKRDEEPSNGGRGFGTDFWRRIEKDGKQIEVGPEEAKIAIPPPSDSDIRNWFLIRELFYPLRMSDGEEIIYMDRFYRSEMEKALQGLQKEQSERARLLQNSEMLLPELRALVAPYTAGYYS